MARMEKEDLKQNTVDPRFTMGSLYDGFTLRSALSLRAFFKISNFTDFICIRAICPPFSILRLNLLTNHILMILSLKYP